MDQKLQESCKSYNKLKTLMDKNSDKVKTMRNFLVDIVSTIEDYAKKLKQHAETFSLDISRSGDDDEILIFYYNFLSHLILNISHQNILTSASIQNQVIEPFDLYVENFNETNKNLLDNANQILENIKKNKIELEKKQEKYYHYSNLFEQYQKDNEYISKKKDQGYISKEELTQYTYDIMSFRNAIDKTSVDYKHALNNINHKWEIFDLEYWQIFENYDLNEENRMHFIKLHISQMIKNLKDSHLDIIKVLQDYNSNSFEKKATEIEQRISNKDMRIGQQIIQNTKANINQLLKREEFISYDIFKKNNIKKKINKEELDKENSIYNNIPEINKQIIDNFIIMLTSEHIKSLSSCSSLITIPSYSFNSINSFNNYCEINEPFSKTILPESLLNDNLISNNSSKLMNILACPTSLRYFLEKLTINIKAVMVNNNTWQFLNQIAFQVIQLIQESKENDKDSQIFYNLIQFITKFYKEEKLATKRRFLCSKYKNSPIWENIGRWESLMYFLYHKRKLESHGKMTSLHQSKIDVDQIVNKIKSLALANQSEALLKYKTNLDENSIKLQVLDDINIYIMYMNLNPDLSAKILLNIAKKLGLANDTIDDFARKLAQRSNALLREQMSSSSYHHQFKYKKMGNLFAIKLALDYLSPYDRLLNILLTCKKWKNAFQNKIFKIALSKPNKMIQDDYRLKIWFAAIDISNLNIDYSMIKASYDSNKTISSTVENLIILDIQRSFHNHPILNPKILQELLILYAYLNPDVSYYQGMHLIMGYLYCLFQNEDITFKFFNTIMNKYLKKWFANDLKHLKMIFYQLDKLISIFLPDLAEHFNNEKVEASLYSTPWFVTIFASAFQFTQFSHTLFRIWDIFILEGWKGFFKVCLAILDIFKEYLLKSRFDDILTFMSELMRHEIFSNEQYVEHLRTKDMKIFKFKSDNNKSGMGSTPKNKDIIHFESRAYINNEYKIFDLENKIKDFENIESFRSRISSFKITNSLLKKLEDDYLLAESSIFKNNNNNNCNTDIQTKVFYHQIMLHKQLEHKALLHHKIFFFFKINFT